MRRYSKAIAAVLGVSALIACQYFKVSIPGLDAVVLNIIIGAATTFGVYQARNSND